MEKVKRAEYKIEKLLKNKKYLKEVKNNKMYLSKVYAENVFSCANKALQIDPCFFLEKKTIVKTNY